MPKMRLLAVGILLIDLARLIELASTIVAGLGRMWLLRLKLPLLPLALLRLARLLLAEALLLTRVLLVLCWVLPRESGLALLRTRLTELLTLLRVLTRLGVLGADGLARLHERLLRLPALVGAARVRVVLLRRGNRACVTRIPAVHVALLTRLARLRLTRLLLTRLLRLTGVTGLLGRVAGESGLARLLRRLSGLLRLRLLPVALVELRLIHVLTPLLRLRLLWVLHSEAGLRWVASAGLGGAGLRRARVCGTGLCCAVLRVLLRSRRLRALLRRGLRL